MNLFERFNITNRVVDKDPNKWNINLNYKKGLYIFWNLKTFDDEEERGVNKKIINNTWLIIIIIIIN